MNMTACVRYGFSPVVQHLKWIDRPCLLGYGRIKISFSLCKEQNELNIIFFLFLQKHPLRSVVGKLPQTPSACHSRVRCHLPAGCTCSTGHVPSRQPGLLFSPDSFLKGEKTLSVGFQQCTLFLRFPLVVTFTQVMYWREKSFSFYDNADHEGRG